jgi:hypothetical protein
MSKVMIIPSVVKSKIDSLLVQGRRPAIVSAYYFRDETEWRKKENSYLNKKVALAGSLDSI